jgi:hypothetical protein
VVILNGSFYLQGSPGYPGIDTGDNLTIVNGFFDCSTIDSSFCFNSSALTFQNGSATAITNYSTVGPSFQSLISGSSSLYFEYLSDSSQEWLSGLPMLHLKSISFFYSTIYALTIRQEGESDIRFERELIFNASRSRGCAFTVGGIGNYSIFYNSTSPPSQGRLGHDGLLFFSVSGPYDNVYSAVPVSFGTATSSETIAVTPGPGMTASLSPEKTSVVTRTSTGPRTATSSEEMTATPDDSKASEGNGMRVALIVVSIVVVLALAVAFAVWWYRRNRKLQDLKYEGLIESIADDSPYV